MARKEIIRENYLENVPLRADIEWSQDDNGIVTLNIVNKGLFNRIAQRLFKKPKISYIHLDEMGSFIWLLIDGEKTIMDFGNPVCVRFGDKAQPLYERLAEFFRILESYGFISFIK